MSEKLVPWLDPWPRLALEQAEMVCQHLRRDNPDPEFVRRHAMLLLSIVSDADLWVDDTPLRDAA